MKKVSNRAHRLYQTDKARISAVQEIERLIDVLGHMTAEQLSYGDYRQLVQFLADHKDTINCEMSSETSVG